MCTITIWILIEEGNIKKNSYERRNYESVDERAYLRLSPENYEKKNSSSKGLNCCYFK